MKWKVKRVSMSNRANSSEWIEVERLASEGWELVAVTDGFYYLKRPIALEMRVGTNCIESSGQDVDRAFRDYIKRVGVRQLV